MDAPLMTPDSIEAQIASARARIVALEKDVQDLALPAVTGDRDAASSLARVNASIGQVRAELAVLEQARDAAARQQAAADAAELAGYRARHLELARGSATRLMEVALRIDSLIDQFAAALREIGEAENAIRKDLLAAHAMPQNVVRGRFTLGNESIVLMLRTINGRAKFHNDDRRGVVHWSNVAWSFLLDTTERQDV